MNYTIEKTAIGLDAYVKSWKPVINAEISGETTFFEAMDAIIPVFDKEIENKHAAVETAISYFVAAKFLCYKTIYRFEPGFIEVLSQTEDTPIYQSLLRNLPVNCFMVALQNSPYIGLIISVELIEQESRISAIGLPNSDMSKASSDIFTLSIHDGETISSAIAKWHERNDVLYPDGTEKTDSESARILTLATQIAYYLSAKNCVVKKITIPKEKRPRRANGTPMNLREWNVGYRVGNVFDPDENRPSSVRISTGSATQGTSPRPHIRRAHFHHYWVGPGKATRIVKWIEPMWVNGNGEAIIPTEHRVVT